MVPTHLRSYTGAGEVEAAGATLGEVLRDLDRRFPGLYFRVIDEQERVRRHILLFVGSARQEELATPLPEGAEVHIVAALSGGAGVVPPESR